MDYQNRAGSKFGGGGVASQSATNADRRERLRKLALETIDLDKDPYFFKNHVGSFECRLCLTVHQNDGSYLAHTQGRKHQTNLARRAAREQKEAQKDGQVGMLGYPGVQVKKNVVKIGRPGYSIQKNRDPMTRQNGLMFQLHYPEITPGVEPKVRFMSAYEQRVEEPNKEFQYLLIAAEPYDTCGFKLQAKEIDRREGKYWTWWEVDSKQFYCQVTFKTERDERYSNVPGLGPGSGRRFWEAIAQLPSRNQTPDPKRALEGPKMVEKSSIRQAAKPVYAERNEGFQIREHDIHGDLCEDFGAL